MYQHLLLVYHLAAARVPSVHKKGLVTASYPLDMCHVKVGTHEGTSPCS